MQLNVYTQEHTASIEFDVTELLPREEKKKMHVLAPAASRPCGVAAGSSSVSLNWVCTLIEWWIFILIINIWFIFDRKCEFSSTVFTCNCCIRTYSDFFHVCDTFRFSLDTDSYSGSCQFNVLLLVCCDYDSNRYFLCLYLLTVKNNGEVQSWDHATLPRCRHDALANLLTWEKIGRATCPWATTGVTHPLCSLLFSRMQYI